MKPDFYTKAVLTVIALMLAVIACKPLFSPETIVSAQGSFAGVQFTHNPTGSDLYFFGSSGESVGNWRGLSAGIE